jgi:hypothetical protein
MYLIISIEHATIPYASEVHPCPTNDLRSLFANGDIDLQEQPDLT